MHPPDRPALLTRSCCKSTAKTPSRKRLGVFRGSRRRGVKPEVGRDGGSVGKMGGGCRGRSTCGKYCDVVLINTACAAAAAAVVLSQPAAEVE